MKVIRKSHVLHLCLSAFSIFNLAANGVKPVSNDLSILSRSSCLYMSQLINTIIDALCLHLIVGLNERFVGQN